MAIQMNIGEAKTRLSELVAATERGEEVVLARAGRPVAKLVVIDVEAERQRIREKRLAFFGSLKGAFPDDIDWTAPTFTEEELDSFERPF